ncbi:MAG: hypothetical protein ACXW2U_18410 [Telluria sp.]
MNKYIKHLAIGTLAGAASLAGAAPLATGDAGKICAFIQQEEARLATQVEGRRGTPDQMIVKGGPATATYRHMARDAKIEYRVSPDGRTALDNAVFERHHLAARGYTEESLAQAMALPRPFPARLELSCEGRTLFIASTNGKLESMSIGAKPN